MSFFLFPRQHVCNEKLLKQCHFQIVFIKSEYHFINCVLFKSVHTIINISDCRQAVHKVRGCMEECVQPGVLKQSKRLDLDDAYTCCWLCDENYMKLKMSHSESNDEPLYSMR